MKFSAELEERFSALISKYPPGRQRSALVPMLLFAQDEVGAITPEVIDEIARRLSLTPLQVDEVIGYYSMLHKKPLGHYHVQVCTNISCLLRGGEDLWKQVCRKLDLENKQTTADGQISIEEVECIGACSWAPAIQVNYDFYHNMTAEKLNRLIDALAAARDGAADLPTPDSHAEGTEVAAGVRKG